MFMIVFVYITEKLQVSKAYSALRLPGVTGADSCRRMSSDNEQGRYPWRLTDGVVWIGVATPGWSVCTHCPSLAPAPSPPPLAVPPDIQAPVHPASTAIEFDVDGRFWRKHRLLLSRECSHWLNGTWPVTRDKTCHVSASRNITINFFNIFFYINSVHIPQALVTLKTFDEKRRFT